MRNALWALLGLWLAALAGPAVARAPVLAELFTSQGCSSCVASSDIAENLARRPGVLLLTFGVDYWDYLGWADTFAKPEFTDRQRAYMTRFALRDVYTPQIIVDGHLQEAAVQAQPVDDLIKQAAHPYRHPPRIVLSARKATLSRGAPLKAAADVWLVRYDPQPRSVLVRRGENRGKTIVEYDVVRELIRLGSWRGRARTYRLPVTSSEGLNTVVIVQAAHGGPVLAVATP